MDARESVMAMMSFKERPLEFEQTNTTIKMEEIIVVGTDFFLMPKKSGIKLIHAAGERIHEHFTCDCLNFSACQCILHKIHIRTD